ncbi:hypothetical protein [Salinispira pacifica]
MFRIRRIYDALTERNARTVERVQEMLRERIGGIQSEFVDGITDQLHNPVGHQFRTILYTAEDERSNLQGFALVSHDPGLRFCLLDFLVASSLAPGRGVGGALYQRVREEAARLNVVGIFMECLPDDPALCRSADALEQNRKRLRFYERYGARPIIGTRYETPLEPGGDCPPYLVFDDLAHEDRPATGQLSGGAVGLRRAAARRIVRAILERKYANYCPPDYIDTVVSSFRDDPVRIRERRYQRRTSADTAPGPSVALRREDRVVLTVTDSHQIHHIKERGYVESPVRIAAILRRLDLLHGFRRVPTRSFSDEVIRRIHDPSLVSIIRESRRMKPGQDPVYPYVFPVHHPDRPPADYTIRAGYFCIDTFTPLHPNVWPAARRAVDCALTAAELVATGDARLSYALVRPPGHHAERRLFGGFCYLNSSAAAAEYLSDLGRVAILDVDFQLGNGQQDIFYRRRDVLTLSIHGHPRISYPYFSGFEDETGEADGAGFNVNFPVAKSLDGEGYRRFLSRALSRIRDDRPDFLVVALGLDTARGDPTGNFLLRQTDFRENGRMIGTLGLPTVVVQEGGYDSRVLGGNADAFLDGLRNGFLGSVPRA